MKKGRGSVSTIIIGPSKSVLVYALHSIEYVLGLARFRVFVPKLHNSYAKISQATQLASKMVPDLKHVFLQAITIVADFTN